MKLDKRGQSTIEFALTIILMMAFLLFYLQLSMVFAFGNYAHYATFMAARAYMAAGSSVKDQQSRAQAVLTQMLKKSQGSGADRFPSLAKGIEGDQEAIPGMFLNPPDQFKRYDQSFSWLQGVRYAFRSKVFILPLTGTPGPSGANSLNSVTLTTESWLGREVNYDECLEDLKPMSGTFDNGC